MRGVLPVLEGPLTSAPPASSFAMASVLPPAAASIRGVAPSLSEGGAGWAEGGGAAAFVLTKAFAFLAGAATAGRPATAQDSSAASMGTQAGRQGRHRVIMGSSSVERRRPRWEHQRHKEIRRRTPIVSRVEGNKQRRKQAGERCILVRNASKSTRNRRWRAVDKNAWGKGRGDRRRHRDRGNTHSEGHSVLEKPAGGRRGGRLDGGG